MSLRRMRRKQVRKMSFRDPVFAQFSAGAMNFHSNDNKEKDKRWIKKHIWELDVSCSESV